MPLLLQRMKAPDGVNDVQVIQIGDTRHFVVSFGSMIKILSSEFRLVSKFLVPFNVLIIHPYQDHYFLIGRSKYHVYKGTRKVKECEFIKSFNKINKILAVRNFMVIIHDGRYSLAKIQEMQIKQEDVLTDSTFFTPLSAEKIDESIHILARTYSRKYLITYSIDNDSFKCHRREISNGNFMFRHTGRIILLDEKGMWHMREKLSYIKEFGNYRVSCAIPVGENSLLFCRNGEIILLNDDYRHEVLGILDCSIDVVSTIDGLYFCGSQDYSYLLRISNKDVQIVERYACIGRGEVISKKEEIEMVCNKEFVTMRYAVPLGPRCLENFDMRARNDSHVNESTHASTEDHLVLVKRSKRSIHHNPLEKEAQALQALSIFPKRFFKGNNVTILDFEGFSIVNGFPFAPISGYFSCNDRDFFNTSDFILEVDSSGKGSVYKIASSIVKYFGSIILIFKKSTISILDTNTKSLKFYDISFELCDFCLDDSSVYCIDFDEHIYKFAVEDFGNCSLEWTTTSLLQLAAEFDSAEQMASRENRYAKNHPILHEVRSYNELFVANCPKRTKDTASNTEMPSSGMLNANGRLFCVNNGNLVLVADVGSFIGCFTGLGNTLIILADKTYAIDLRSKKTSIVDFKASASFIHDKTLYLYGDGCLAPFEWTNPVFTCKKMHCDLSNAESLICMIDGECMYSYYSLDRRTVNYRLGSSILSFPSYIESCRCIIREELVCTALIDVDTRTSKLVFIAIKNRKLKIREVIPQPLVPLSICSLKNIVVSVCPNQLMIMKIHNNRIRRLKHIQDRNDLCAGSFFIGKSTVVIFNEDWCFKTINLKKGTLKKTTVSSKCIPFALNKVIGYAVANSIHFPNGEIDCIEDISNVISISSEILIFGKNGSVFRIKEISDDENVNVHAHEAECTTPCMKFYF